MIMHENIDTDVKKVGILNFVCAIRNWGSILVAYALQRKIEELGYATECINWYGNTDDNSVYEQFKKKHVTRTQSVKTYSEFLQLNNRYDRIVVGGDQVWNTNILPAEIGMLAWASGKKNLVSYSASFGEVYWPGDVQESCLRALLSRFDAISVREDSAVSLCKSLGFEAEQTLDPTLLLSRTDYEQFILDENFKPEKNKYVATYFIIKNEYTDKIYEDISNCGYEIIDLQKNKYDSISVGAWLSYIKNAQYVVTDSFHGTLFSLLFKKNVFPIFNFFCSARIPSLLKQFGIERKIYTYIDFSFSKAIHHDEIKYEKFDDIHKNLQQKSLSFLKKSLSLGLMNKEKFDDNVLLSVKKINNNDIENNITTFSTPYDYEFDTSLRTPQIYPINLATQCYFNTCTDNTIILKQDKLIEKKRNLFLLLITYAKNILHKNTIEKIINSREYLECPEKLYELINQTIRDRHQGYLFNEIDRLAGKEVYFYGYGSYYQLKRNMFVHLKPRCFLVDWRHDDSFDGIPIKNAHEVLMTGEVLPIILFTGQSVKLAKRITSLYPKFTDIIPCAML